MIVLIPSFEPGTALPELVRALAAHDVDVLVVDDGSGPEYAARFAESVDAGALVVRHDRNLGKGRALKTGFAVASELWPGEPVVTADGDGQHRVGDILRVAALTAPDGGIVLGVRDFAGDVPARSRVGNRVSRLLFRMVTGARLRDTQTGLRGHPARLLDWLVSLPGERFDFELIVLMEATAQRVPLVETTIETVYLDHNASSHFRPVVDSVRVLWPLLGFALSSFGAFLLDTLALQILVTASGSLVLAVVGARLISGTANFLVNRYAVFRLRTHRGMVRDAVRYALLALALAAGSYAGLALLTSMGVPLLVAKVVTEVTLYVLSFQVQRLVVFARGRRGSTSAAGGAPASCVVDGSVRLPVLGEDRDRLIAENAVDHTDTAGLQLLRPRLVQGTLVEAREVLALGPRAGDEQVAHSRPDQCAVAHGARPPIDDELKMQGRAQIPVARPHLSE
ncbi:glycosyltransferase [Schumannella luteola]